MSTPIQAACAILTDGENVILQIRDQQHPRKGCGLWSLFGGAVEKGENLGEALLRELDEELKLSIPPPDQWLPPVDVQDDFGHQWTWNPAIVRMELSAFTWCSEGFPVLVSIPVLKRALEMENQPVLKGPHKGQVQNLFFPGIAEVLRMWVASLDTGVSSS
jgi:8-oxo-dGTP pyrophosphatase MutT (NUDIX family)